MPNWRKARAATMAPRLAKLTVLEGTPCHFCAHPRSSHSSIVLTAPCKVAGCGCPVFDPLCGCAHLLSEHTWGTPPHPWECAFCPCHHFGADMSGQVERKPVTAVVMDAPAAPLTPKPAPEVHEARQPSGAVYRWGRRTVALFDCYQAGCDDLATYWMTRAWRSKSDRLQTAQLNACGRHFRQWSAKWMPPQQLGLFDQEATPDGP